MLCNKDVWAYIVALLDSGNAALNAAGSVALPVSLPPGFGSVSTTAGPSTTPGAFAAFNRALAGKAGLELAYAIARGTTRGTHAHRRRIAERRSAHACRQRHQGLGTV